MDNILILSVLGMMALLALFFILLLVLFLRQKQVREQGKARRAAPDEPARSARPRVARVAVVWPGEGVPLLWSVDGKSYAHPDEVTEPEHHAALATFFEILQRTVLPPAPVRAPAPLDTAPKPAIVPPPPPPAAEELPAWLTAAPAPRPASRPAPRPARPLSYEEAMEQPLVERLKSSFLTGRMRAISGTETLEKLEKPAIPQLDELDQLLRARLVGLPHAPSASIRQGSSGLLEIMVAGRIYESIDDVPHDEVRQAMREAVRAWEGGIL